MTAAPTSTGRGRLLIVLAASLWSLGGALAKLLTHDTFLGVNAPPLHPLAIACYRVLFAGLVLIPTLRRADVTFRPMMLVMVLSFAAMNALYVSALTLGPAANAILLQYTAPLWMYLAGVWWLGEPADRRSLAALALGLVGVVVMVWGGQTEAQLGVVVLGLSSGVAYAGVVVCLRVLREASPRWLTVLNHAGGGLVLVPFVCTLQPPTGPQLAVLAFFGVVQMAIPYWLAARALQVLSPQEAGTILLLEPILNPLWAYLVAGEVPPPFTFWGGAFILGALAWRYWPKNT